MKKFVFIFLFFLFLFGCTTTGYKEICQDFPKESLLGKTVYYWGDKPRTLKASVVKEEFTVIPILGSPCNYYNVVLEDGTVINTKGIYFRESGFVHE